MMANTDIWGFSTRIYSTQIYLCAFPLGTNSVFQALCVVRLFIIF